MAAGVLGTGRVELGESALCRLGVARIAAQGVQALQRQRRDAVARRRGVVVARLGTLDEPLVVVAGEEESAAFPVLELLEQHIGKVLGELEDDPGRIRPAEARVMAASRNA